MTTDDRIALATEWLDKGELPPRERMNGYWDAPESGEPVAFVRIARERREHGEQADAYATAQLGYGDPILTGEYSSLSDETEAWEATRNAEYERLEASVREARIQHLASLIDPA